MTPSGEKTKKLGILLCYNDGDFLPDAIEHLLNNNHDLVVWDHGSDDETPAVIRQYEKHLLEKAVIPRTFDFYKLYQRMSGHIIKNYKSTYEWISWPDQDEILEGPDRSKSYSQWVDGILDTDASYVQFNNFNFWFTEEDDQRVTSPVERIRRYALFPDCAPRFRAWRASATNIRVFNHNPPEGAKYAIRFNLKHYAMRSSDQMIRRLKKDRANLETAGMNWHYNHMSRIAEKLIIPASALHYDDGVSPLNPDPIFNWRELYGSQNTIRIPWYRRTLGTLRDKVASRFHK